MGFWAPLAVAAVTTIGGLIAGEQQKSAAKSAASAQKEGIATSAQLTREQLAEQRRQYDTQLDEYRRRQGNLEEQYTQLQTMLAPYQQGGQGAFYEMLALAGVAAPEGAKITQNFEDVAGTYTGGISDRYYSAPTTTTTPGQMSILSKAVALPSSSTGDFTLPANVDPMAVAAELNKGGLSLSSSRWDAIDPNIAAQGKASPRYYAAQLMKQIKNVHPDWNTQQIFDEITSIAPQAAEQRRVEALRTPSRSAEISPVESPYIGMTGAQAQEAALAKIADSPLLAELTAQGESAILQNQAATGGLRGGNTQGLLARYRPQMLQSEIERQYSRLGQISGMGLGATTTAPYSPSASGQPGIMPIDTTLSNLALKSGEVSAAQALAEAEANSRMIGDISSGLGMAFKAYQGGTSADNWTSANAGVQAVVNPDGTISYY